MPPASSRLPRAQSAATDLPAPSVVRRVLWVMAAGAWLFLFLAFATFDVADWPSHVVAVHQQPTGNWCGPAGAVIAYHGSLVLGSSIWVLLIGAGALLGVTASGRAVSHPFVRTVGVTLAALAVAGLHSLWMPGWGSLVGAETGLLPRWIVDQLLMRFSTVGVSLLLVTTVALGAVVAIDSVVFMIPGALWRAAGWFSFLRNVDWMAPMRALGRLRHVRLPNWPSRQPVAAAVGILDEQRPSVPKRKRRAPIVEQIDPDAGGLGATQAFDPDEAEVAEADDAPEPSASTKESRQQLSEAELRKKIAKLPVRMTGKIQTVARDEDIPRQENFEGYQFPTLELLEDPESNFSEKMETYVREQATILEQTLQTYGIDGEVAGIESGPVVTLFAVQLAPGTRVARVQAISSDLARSLQAQNIRIIPNVPGRTTIGIEVPNLQKEKVRLKELMSGGQAQKMGLPMFLGKDASGEPLVADLTRMPHMLIAGTTGSGKSVCMNTIIMSWLYTKRPDELKLVLVDPKMVEMSQFAEIPHLMCPVVTEMSKAAAILEWAVNKMEERYELLKEALVRDIGGYNSLTEEELFERFNPQNDAERAKIPKKLPFMVFIIDELADLMMTNKEVEHAIVRIAQKARAVGIHLVLATQRPQANVVTGLIKSNMPCRVSFKVASGMDSRIVLDSKGAELLLGQGDMLFLTPQTSELRRAQATLVTDNEIRKVVRFLKDVASPTFERSLLSIRSINSDGEETGGLSQNDRDPLFDQAVEIMIESGRGSVSLLQRRLAIGYSRASRLVDQMGLAGILGEHKGSVAREVVITLEEWHRMKALEEEAAKAGTVFETAGAPTSDSDGGVPDEFDDEYRN